MTGFVLAFHHLPGKAPRRHGCSDLAEGAERRAARQGQRAGARAANRAVPAGQCPHPQGCRAGDTAQGQPQPGGCQTSLQGCNSSKATPGSDQRVWLVRAPGQGTWHSTAQAATEGSLSLSNSSSEAPPAPSHCSLTPGHSHTDVAMGTGSHSPRQGQRLSRALAAEAQEG